ncbi:AEC family transporter [Bermanella marisrubri]|uniref:Auxin Efflux Carrier n=1 Tax=Bermanella marisrubri TaxID=207949 RepID=Q1N5L1_9GAMM|nr:AEC family transporter [Bermanella marisrubri]EAT13931.1 hypothetical protein RED65_11074 [Oceanobacter sp. RED65] [Bermanella marisrubri]QIZ84682.1 AEC family transporter [Bermanella marisrubri]
MFLTIFQVVAPVWICAAIGFMWVRSGNPFPSDFISRLVFNIAAPCLVISTMASVELSMSALMNMAMAAALVLLCVLSLSYALIRLFGHDTKDYLVSLSFANVGNMGLPVCLFAFGETGLALAVAYFIINSIAHFSLGVSLSSGRSLDWQDFLKNPILWAIAVAVGLIFFQLSLPNWLENTVTLIGDMTIPLMLITLGVSLAGIQVKSWKLGLFYSTMRFVIGGSVAMFVVWLLDLHGLQASIVIIQGLMPVAIFNYLFALQAKRDADTVASMVMISTLLSMVVVPTALALLLASNA